MTTAVELSGIRHIALWARTLLCRRCSHRAGCLGNLQTQHAVESFQQARSQFSAKKKTSNDRSGVTSHISYQKPSQNLIHWHTMCGVLSGSQTCCMPMQACHSLPVIQFSALFTLPSSVTRLFWAKKPYNSAFCLVIMQLDSTSSRLIHVAENAATKQSTICINLPHPPTSDDRIGVTSPISYQKPSQNLIHWHTMCGVLSGSQTCCMPMQACHSSSSQLYLPSRVQSPGSFEQKSLITRPSVLSSCSWIQHHHVSFMLRRTQQPSNQQYASICHIHPHPMIGLGWQVLFRTKNQVKISYTDTQCAECFQGLKHVACLCKRVILCQSSSSQLYLPSRVQSPGSFEQKSLITRPSVLSSCSWIQLQWMSNSLASNFRWCVFTLLTCPAVTYSKGWSWNISSCAGQAGAATWTRTSSCRNGTGWGRSGREAQGKIAQILYQFITTTYDPRA